MSNMSYCRFENTASDFGDCANALNYLGESPLSESEAAAAERLFEMARDALLEIASVCGKSIEGLERDDIRAALLTMTKEQAELLEQEGAE